MRAVVVIALTFLLAASAPAAPFVNLDFEQATVPSGTGSQMSASLAFPGWTARYENTKHVAGLFMIIPDLTKQSSHFTTSLIRSHRSRCYRATSMPFFAPRRQRRFTLR